jgi:hypothetical protein
MSKRGRGCGGKIRTTGDLWYDCQLTTVREERKARGEPKHHYHRCPWCGVLMRCDDLCGSRFDYPDNTPNTEGVFSGVECDSDCYQRRRPYGCRYDQKDG